jgi:hypothetical protein
MLTDESFAQGFADGTEDAREQARYINSERKAMQPLYDFLDPIVMQRAWTPDWYKDIQSRYEDFKKIDYDAAFYMFKNSFTATWPDLLEEPESDRVLIADNMNEMRELFGNPLNFNYKKLKNFTEPGLDVQGQPLDAVKKQHPWSAADSVDTASDAIILLSEAAKQLKDMKDRRHKRLEDRRDQRGASAK